MTATVLAYNQRYFDGVDALWREAFPSDEPRHCAAAVIPKKLLEHPELFLIVLDGDKVVGSVMAGYDGYRGWLNRVAVLASHRRRGIGAALIRAAEAQLRALGCGKINLQINSSNELVAGFYRRLGYDVEERISMGKIVSP
jgi:ribosomal protein S18 acetylase RimI-like enzyme